VRADIVPRGAFPDYQLTDHLGAKRRLSDLQREHPYLSRAMGNPVVLVLGRRRYCPKDQLQHRDLVGLYPKHDLYILERVAILTNSPLTDRVGPDGRARDMFPYRPEPHLARRDGDGRGASGR